MSIFRRPPPPEEAPPRAIIAAAQRINRADRAETEKLARRRQANGWQEDAWSMYDAIGEIKYGFNLVAWAISRCRIYPAVFNEDGGDPIPVREADDLTPGLAEAAHRALNRLARGPRMSEMLRTLAVNMQVAGDCWLVQQPRSIMSERNERWSVRSVSELRITADGGYTIVKNANGGTQDSEELPANAYVARLWKNHPRFYENADSSMLGVLEKCDELLMLDRMVRSVARARINAGILAISEDFVLLDDPEGEGDPVRFEDELQYSLSAPVSDESAAPAVVPLMIRGPLEQIKEGIAYYEIAREVQPELVARADRALERILQGIDLPKDMVTGLAQVKYSNALVISDSLYSAHIQPLIQLICDQLTEAYLQTAVQAYGFTAEQAERLVVWYDASEILQDADKSESANKGIENNAISWEAWRRENGYTDNDAPSPDELVLKILLARSTLEEPTAQSLIRTIAPRLMEKTAEADQASTVGPLTEDVQSILQGGEAPAGEAAPGAAAPAETEPPL